jgi:hypothetical protein
MESVNVLFKVRDLASGASPDATARRGKGDSDE